MPADEGDALEGGPVGGEEAEDVWVAGVEGEVADGGEELGEVASEDVVGGGKEGVAPWGEEGKIEVGDGAEGGGYHEEVADVAAEGEGCAGRPFQEEPLAAHQRHGVPAADVGDQGEHVPEDHVR